MKTIAIFGLLLNTVFGFWQRGHLLVSRHAESILAEEDPIALENAIAELRNLTSYSSLVKDEDEHPFTECAIFADNIKGKGMTWQSTWHYNNNEPIFENVPMANFELPRENIIDALDSLTEFLKGNKTDSFYIEQIE